MTFDDNQVVRLIHEFRAGNAMITEDEIVKGIQIIGSWAALGGWYAPQAEPARRAVCGSPGMPTCRTFACTSPRPASGKPST